MRRLALSGPFVAFFLHELRSVTRRSRFWLLLIILPFFTVSVAPRLIWNYINLGFPCIIFLIYLIPFVYLLPAWRQFQRSRFYDELILTRLAKHEIFAGFITPRILIVTILFAVAYSSTSFVIDEPGGFFGPTKYTHVDFGAFPVLISIKAAVSLGDHGDVWSNWQIPFAVFFFAFTVSYGAIVVAYLCRRRRSFLMITFRLLIMTFVMDAAFYAIAFTASRYAEFAYGYITYADTGSAAAVAMRQLILHLSRPWLPWWYFLIKCAIGYKLIKLIARRLNGPAPSAAL